MEKVVKATKTSGHVYVGKEWVGKTVIITDVKGSGIDYEYLIDEISKRTAQYVISRRIGRSSPWGQGESPKAEAP